MSSKEERHALALLIADAVKEGVKDAIKEIIVPPPTVPPPLVTVTTRRELAKLAVRKESYVTADTDIFGEDGIAITRDGTVGVCVCFDTAGVLSFNRKKGGPYEKFNEGANLAAGGTYYFSVLVEQGDALNFRYSVNAKLISMYVYFVPDIA